MAPTSSSPRKSSRTTTHQSLRTTTIHRDTPPKIRTTKGSTITTAKGPTSSYSHHYHDNDGFVKKRPIVRVVRVFAPKIVTANADNFRAIVQSLTGNLSPLHTVCVPASNAPSPDLSVQSSPNMSPFTSNSIPTPLPSPHSPPSESMISSLSMSSSTSPTNLAVCLPNLHPFSSSYSSSQNHGSNIISPSNISSPSLHDPSSFSDLLLSNLQTPYVPRDSESSSSSSTNSFPREIIDNCFPTISDGVEYDSFETPTLAQGTPNHVIHTYNELYRIYPNAYPPQCYVNRHLHVEEDETSLFNEFDTMLSSIKLPNF